MNKISVCINLDTLALGTDWELPLSKDPTYKLIDERLISRLEKFGFKAVIFAVGKDLESLKNRQYIKKWSQAGHSIGNHSYSHPLNLASLPEYELDKEIGQTDLLIQGITGKKPISFNAPGWAMSTEIDEALSSHGYKIDFSPFLSWFMYPLLLKQWFSLRKKKIARTVWDRKDILYPLINKSIAYKTSQKIKKIPLPMAGVASIPIWHTGWFVYGEAVFVKLLKLAIKTNSEFYYLMHPADVISLNDIPKEFVDKVNFERISCPLKNKLKYLDVALELIT